MNLRVSITVLNLMMLNSAPVIGQDLARSPLSQSVAVQETPQSPLYQRSLGRSLALQDELTTATQLLQQGMTAYQANQFNAAIASWQQALTLFRQIKNRQGEEFTLGLLITGYLAIGDYNHILVSAEQWLKIASDDSNRAKAMGYLGIAYKNLGDYAQAIEIQQQALTIFQKLQDPQSTGQLLNNLGNTYAVIGDYDRANPIYQQSLEIARQRKDLHSEANVLSNLGAISTDMGNDEQALTLYQQSLKIAELPQINDLPLQVGILINLGTTYHFLGQYSLGMTNYQKGLALAQQINNPQLQGNVLSNLGLIYEDRNNYSQSIQAHKQSIAIAEASNNPQAEALARNNLAHVLLAAKSLGEAEEQLNSAIKLLDRVRSQLSDLEQVNIFDTQVSTYNLLQQVLIANNKPETALEALEKGRARAFAQLLSNRFNTSSKIQTARAKSLETLSIEQIRQIAKQQNATLVSYGIIPDEAFKFRGKQRGREAELFIWVVQPTGKVTFRRVNLQPLWKQDITLQELVSISLCLDTAPTCNTIEEFVRIRNRRRKSLVKLADKETVSSGQYPGLKELYQILVAPISDLLPKNPEEEVIFIPQDSLLLVPFAALQTPDNKFLIQKHTIRVAPSIQVLSLTYQQRQRQRQSPNRLEIVVVGNPTMPSVRPIPGEVRSKLDQLPNAEKEAIAIAKSFNTQAIVGDAATKANVLPKLKQTRLIHLATHGLLAYNSRTGGIQKEIPGAIALAPAGKDDGLLTASEIFDLNLNAQLVVLSACDTGQGRVTGDGVVGLSRAWIAAGVPSAIVSLRKVPDKQTSDLMTSFYQHWKKTPNIARALRHGTLETIKKYPYPRAWGAFISIGESE